MSREQTTYTNGQGTFSVVPAWRLQVQDDRLLLGLVLAATYNRAWREQVAPGLAAQGTCIEWGDLPEGVGGRLDTRRNRITVSRALEPEGFGVLAAVLSHEVYHAVTAHGADTAACLAEEAAASTWEAGTGRALPEGWRSRGEYGRDHDRLARLARAGGIDAYVAGSPDYQRQCAP